MLKELDQLQAVDLDLARNGGHDVAGDSLRDPEVSAGVGALLANERFNRSSRLARQARGCCWRPCWWRFPRPPVRSRESGREH